MESYLKPALAEKIRTVIVPKAFATQKAVGNTMHILLLRDTNEDGSDDNVVVTDVLVTFAAREPAAVRAGASAYMGADGALARESPFPVRSGDRFRLPASATSPPGGRGVAGVISVVMPEEFGVVRALFTLQA